MWNVLNLVPKQSMEKHGIIMFIYILRHIISSYLSIHLYNKKSEIAWHYILEFYLTCLYRCFSPYFHLVWLLDVAGCVSRRWGPGNPPLVLRSSLHWSDLRLFVTGDGGGFWKKTTNIGMYQHYNMLENNHTYINIHDLVADSNGLIKLLYTWIYI